MAAHLDSVDLRVADDEGSRPDDKIQSSQFPQTAPIDEGSPRQCLRIVDLGFGRATMEIPGARLGIRRTQLRVPSVEDPYVLLAIYYMIISIFTWCRRKRSYAVCLLSIFCLSVGLFISGALASFIYATSLGFYKSPSRLLLRVALLGLLHIWFSPYWAEPGILIMGTRRVYPCHLYI